MPIIAIAIVLVLVAADQVTKWLVVANIPLGGSVTVIDGFLQWRYIQNYGAAFGVLQNQRWIFIGFTAVVVVAAIIFLFTKYCRSKFLTFALALVIAGGIGNLIDRIVLGYVVDFISVSFFPPIFNFADCCVCIGAVLLVAFVLFFPSYDPIKQKKVRFSPRSKESER